MARKNFVFESRHISKWKFLNGMSYGALGLVGSVGLFGRSSLEAITRPPEEQRPNFVFILIDDLGWTDLGCYGSAFYETPNIDKLTSQGIKFTDAYAACTVCSPSRAAILTGKYPARLHLTDWITGHKRPWAKLRIPDWTMCLPLEEVTIAEALKPVGYTSAHIGKWHLTNKQDTKELYYPKNQGFNLNIGGSYWGQPIHGYFSPYNMPHLKNGPGGEYLTDRLTDEAVKFIEKNRDDPFFLYFAHYAVHTPLQAKKELIEKYKAKIKPEQAQNNPVYAAMIESVDESVGRIMKKLEELKIVDRTVIFFTSDNGGLIGGKNRVTSNAPLRAGKGSAYEGGVRVPLIVRWPGVVKPGSVCDVPVIGVDFYPTILEVADVKFTHAVDGVSLVPLLKQTSGLERNTIYWHYPHYHPGGATPYSALRRRDLRLIEFYEDGHLEEYNLKEDIGERNNLANRMPEKAEELRKELDYWLKSVNAQMPTPNPDYNPE